MIRVNQINKCLEMKYMMITRRKCIMNILQIVINSIIHKMLVDEFQNKMARIGLPLNIEHEFYWRIDLHNLMNFLLNLDLLLMHSMKLKNILML